MPDMSEQNQDVHDIQALSNEEVQAFLRNDVEALALVWSDDFVVTNPLNKFVNKQQVLGMVRSGFLKMNSYSRKIEYSHEYNGTIVIAGSEEVIWGGQMPHAGKTESLRFTAIWTKQKGRWQEVARHANIVPQP
jgi:ketosteroid isomerase-like protein